MERIEVSNLSINDRWIDMEAFHYQFLLCCICVSSLINTICIRGTFYLFQLVNHGWYRIRFFVPCCFPNCLTRKNKLVPNNSGNKYQMDFRRKGLVVMNARRIKVHPGFYATEKFFNIIPSPVS